MTNSNELPGFSDPEVNQERFGFDDGYSSFGLPGSTWAEGNMFYGRHFVPNLNMEDAVFTDTAWSKGRYDSLELFSQKEDRVLAEILFSDAVRRLQAVEQLTLPPKYSTVPNTAAFSRFEHIWGSVLFVRQMAKKTGIEPDESMHLQLRTLVSDIAHTTGSHLGDWLFQGMGGPEDQHDVELSAYLEVTGINDILRQNNIEPEDVTFPKVNDWVEAKSPDLCVDRVDYGLREMNRTNDVAYLHNFSAEDFTITPENMLAMTDQRRARVFAESYLLLSEENWSEPTHYFIEQMLLLRTKLLYAEGGGPDTWVFKQPPLTGLVPLDEIHPRDLMYVTDPSQMASFAMPSLSGHTIDSIMSSTALYHRQYVWPGRRERINRYLEQFSTNAAYEDVLVSGMHKPIESPGFSSFKNEYPSTLPSGFAILSPDQAEKSKGPNDIDFPQVPFKIRQINPLVQNGDEFIRLSELDPSYAERLSEHEKKAKLERVARLSIPNPITYGLMRQVIETADLHWEERLRTSRRMTAPELRSLIKSSASEVHGSYPFMTFFSY